MFCLVQLASFGWGIHTGIPAQPQVFFVKLELDWIGAFVY